MSFSLITRHSSLTPKELLKSLEPVSIGQVTAAMNGRLLQGNPETVVSGIAIDSRGVNPGQLFFAFPGSRADGHRYVGDALSRGAAAAVISRQVPVESGQPLIMVADPLQALQDLAGYYRRLFPAPVVAVTGSTGKTTTKDLIAGVLAAGMRVLKTEGNQNNEIGLPLTLMRLTHDYDAVVLEMAMRGRGEIAALCRISQPQVGVITNIGMTHIERLGSQQAIADAKGELLEALPLNGCAVLNWEDPWQRQLASKCRSEVIFYGLDGEAVSAAAVSAQNIVLHGLQGTEFLLRTPLGEAPCRLPLPGRHNISNALAAAGVGSRFGLQPEQIAHGLATVSLTGMRQEVKQGIGGSTIIDDTYNASPASVKAALRLLADVTDRAGTEASPGTRVPTGVGAAPVRRILQAGRSPDAEESKPAHRGRAIAVLGNMYELGPETVSGHRAVGEYAATLQIDYLFTVGDLAGEIARAARDAGLPGTRIGVFDDNRGAIAFMRDFVKSGDVVLVKGSRAARMEEIVAPLSEGGLT
jgi:UDP-N-acetylmuramoyl-tripeptide--D-alanyl-D-alanine ligase